MSTNINTQNKYTATNINTQNKYTATNNTKSFKAEDLATKKQKVITKIYAAKSYNEVNNLFNTHISLLLKKQGLSFFDNKLPHSFQLAFLRKVQANSNISDIKSLSKIELNKVFGEHLNKWCINEIINDSNKLDAKTLENLQKIAKDCIDNPKTNAHFEIAIKSLEQEHGVNSYFSSYDRVSTKLCINEKLNSFILKVNTFCEKLMNIHHGHYYLNAENLKECNKLIKECDTLDKTTFLTKSDNEKYNQVKEDLKSRQTDLIENLNKLLISRCQKELNKLEENKTSVNPKLRNQAQDFVKEIFKYLVLIPDSSKIIDLCAKIIEKANNLELKKPSSQAPNRKLSKEIFLEEIFTTCKENITKDYIEKMRENNKIISHSNAKEAVDKFWDDVKTKENYPPTRKKFILLLIHPDKHPNDQELANAFFKHFNKNILTIEKNKGVQYTQLLKI